MAEKRLEEIRNARLHKREQLIKTGQVPYPAEARRTHTGASFLEEFEALQGAGGPVILAGRVMNMRKHGGVVFMDLHDLSGSVQLQLTRDDSGEDVFERLDFIDVGDFIQATGEAIQTTRGVPTLFVADFHVLSKSIRPLPDSWYGLKDQETRLRQRELDLLLNPDVQRVMRIRSHVIEWIRRRLHLDGFLEVETPILQPIAGGAAARPFVTHHNSLDQDLYLRIAPELYLKRLLVAGFEMVFEIGKNFRNEGIDREHSPEFTMCELYWAYADYEDLMDYTETLLTQLLTQMVDGDTLTYQEHTISLRSPWKREKFTTLVSRELGVDILTHKDPDTYMQIMEKAELDIPTDTSYEKLVDELYKELIRPKLIQPTLLYDYPVELAPLAKQSIADERVAEKFQLLLGGTELVNAYTELNDPVIQRERFLEQEKQRRAGSQEVPREIDEDYLRAMEQGMPPAGGWGLGIDRLVAIISGAPNLRDTILFPLLRSEHD